MPPGTIVSSGSLVTPGGAQGPSGATLPVGSVIAYCAGGTPPASWMVADGSAISRTLYPDLFTAIGTTYGTGDGSTTFNLPDLRGRTPFGAGQGTGLTNRALAATGGEETHHLLTAELPSHAHNIKISIGTVTSGGSGGYSDANGASTYPTVSTGSDTPHNTMPPFLVLVWIIKVSVTGGPTAQAPIANQTQAGLVNILSGNAADYVGGDNACHRFAFPADQPWAYGPFDDHFDNPASGTPNAKWVQTLTSGMNYPTFTQASSMLCLSGACPSGTTDYENSVYQALPAQATHTITVAFKTQGYPLYSQTSQAKIFFTLAYGANAGGLRFLWMFYVNSGTGATTNDLRLGVGAAFGTTDSDFQFSALPPYLQFVYDASQNTTVKFSWDGNTFMTFGVYAGSETGFATNAPAQWRMGILVNALSRAYLQVDWIKHV